jgi:hypothetical protein
MVQNSEWGPHLWRILHTLAERLGLSSGTAELLKADEAREWFLVLRATERVMPCALCRKHYSAWRKTHPIEKFMHLREIFLKQEARKWLWELHENVNSRREISSGIDLAKVESIYKARTKEDFQQDIDILVKKLKEYMLQANLIDPSAFREWQSHLGMLRKLIGF